MLSGRNFVSFSLPVYNVSKDFCGEFHVKRYLPQRNEIRLASAYYSNIREETSPELFYKADIDRIRQKKDQD